jgi:uncharacterized protein (DUF427 family)
VEPSRRRVRVVFASITVADSVHALRVLETSHPPVYYVPPKDVLWDHLRRSERRTVCEFKGTADYYTLVSDGHVSENAAWSYPDPGPATRVSPATSPSIRRASTPVFSTTSRCDRSPATSTAAG